MSGVGRSLFVVSACTYFLSVAGLAQALVPVQDGPQAFSVLEHSSSELSPELAVERTLALKALQRSVGSSFTLDWQRNGSFAFLRNRIIGRPLIPHFAADGRNAEEAARQFITRYAGLFGLDRQGLSTLVLDRNGVIGATAFAKGVHYVSFVQEADGIPVDQARVTFAIHVDTGALYAITSNVFGAPDSRTSHRALSPRQGVQKVLEVLKIQGSPQAFTIENQWMRFQIPSEALDGPVSIKPVYLPDAPGSFVAAYVAEVWTRAQGLLRVGVDATTGRHLLTIPRTAHFSYQMSGWEEYPLLEGGTLLDPTVIASSPDPIASPDGWLSPKASDGYYHTIGPNVIAFYDWDGTINDYEYVDGMLPLTARHTGITNPGTVDEEVTFDYSEQWASRDTPTQMVQLSLMENFRALNELHDRLYQLGFTESEGNFQGDDPVIVNAQDGYDIGSRTNANFSTPEDGTSGRMNMYVFQDMGGDERDGTMDRQIFAHELGHGLSHRLVNFGDNYLFGAQSGAFGEGHADVTAFMGEQSWSSTSDTFALAPYVGFDYWMYVSRGPALYLVSGLFASQHTKPMGRFTAYTYDVGDEYRITDYAAQRTLEHWGRVPVAEIGNGSYGNVFVGFFGNYSYTVYPETHSDGEIWSAAIWRTRVRLEEHSWNVSMAERLLSAEQTFTMGMQLMPYNPSYMQARDALIIYEEMTQDEPMTCMLKFEFARTGMGAQAYTGPDGSYGSEADYDEAIDAFDLIRPDFVPWGCAPGTYTTTMGDPTVSFSGEAEEVEIQRETALTLRATTPGYSTTATVTGPFIGTVELTPTTDWINEEIAFTPDANGDAQFEAFVSSVKGESATESVSMTVVTPTELAPAGDVYSGDLALEESAHFKLYIDTAQYQVGEGFQVSLSSLDEVDIDLYFKVDRLALLKDNDGFDADEDGQESLQLQLTSEGWEVVNGSGTVYPLEPEGDGFWFYAMVYGFTASAYELDITAITP